MRKGDVYIRVCKIYIFTCKNCDKMFVRRKPHGTYCSNPCKIAKQKGKAAPRFKGGTVSTKGYKVIRVNRRQTFEHRHVMEQHLGRPLLETEVIHHKNGVKLDNRVENLEVINGHAEHATVHYQRFRSETEKQCSKCKDVKPRSEFPPAFCGGIDPNGSHCRACIYRKNRARLDRLYVERGFPPRPSTGGGRPVKGR